MAFTKGMKKGLSVLLSLAMVVTSVSVNGKKADAETAKADYKVTVNDVNPVYTDFDFTGAVKFDISGKVETETGKDLSTLTAANFGIQIGRYEVAENATTGAITWEVAHVVTETGITVKADGTFSAKAKLDNPDLVWGSDLWKKDGAKVLVTLTDDGGVKYYGVSKGFTITSKYSIDGYKSVLSADRKKVTVSGVINRNDADDAATGDVTLNCEALGVTDEKVTLDGEGKFTKDITIPSTAKVLDKFTVDVAYGTNYKDSTSFVLTPSDEDIYAEFVGMPEVAETGKASNPRVLISEDGTYTFSLDNGETPVELKNSYIDFKYGNGAAVKTGEDAPYVYETVSVKIDGVEQTLTDADKANTDDGGNMQRGIYNPWNDAASFSFILNSDKLVTNPAESWNNNLPVKSFELKFKITYNKEEEKTDNTVATATTVSAITTTKKAITATAGAATTVAMTVNVAGKNLSKVDLAKAVSVAAVSAAGVTVKVSSKAATASAATLEAVLTIPATVATGAYPVVAILDTKTVSAASVAVEKVQLATLSVVEAPAAPEAPADEKVATTKLKLATSTGTNKITMGVGETAKIKVTQKPKNSTDEITVASSKKAVVKASLKAKNVVLKAKKAGVSKVTVAAGEVSKKLTVTVKKAPKKLTLKDGKKAAKKTVKMTAKKTKKKAVKKSYKIVLPKNTASYGYTIKKTGKAAKKITATVNTSKKGVQTLVVTAKKKAAGAAKVVITSNANKKAKATVKVKASK